MIVHRVLPLNPESAAQFHELSTPTKEIKRVQATMKTACFYCNNSQSEKLVCAKVSVRSMFWSSSLISLSAKLPRIVPER